MTEKPDLRDCVLEMLRLAGVMLRAGHVTAAGYDMIHQAALKRNAHELDEPGIAATAQRFAPAVVQPAKPAAGKA